MSGDNVQIINQNAGFTGDDNDVDIDLIAQQNVDTFPKRELTCCEAVNRAVKEFVDELTETRADVLEKLLDHQGGDSQELIRKFDGAVEVLRKHTLRALKLVLVKGCRPCCVEAAKAVSSVSEDYLEELKKLFTDLHNELGKDLDKRVGALLEEHCETLEFILGTLRKFKKKDTSKKCEKKKSSDESKKWKKKDTSKKCEKKERKERRRKRSSDW